MADEAGERTEQPTARRLQEAREAGQVTRSADLTAAVVLLGAFLLLAALGDELGDALLRLARGLGASGDVRLPDRGALFDPLVVDVVRRLIPYLALLVVIALGASLVQSGWVFTPRRLAPSLDHLSPARGVRRLFSTQSLVRLLTGVLKAGLVGLVAYVTIAPRVAQIVGASAIEPAAILHGAAELMATLALRLALVLLLLGLLDYFYQRWSLHQSLKMTRQQVKDELKRMEGDPVMKHRRRQVQARLAMQRIALDVPRSDVVVSNPTEFAVALRYDEASMEAPRVVAKGADLLAARIRQVAQQHGIPIVQRPPLARALYAACDPGDEIPRAYYRAVAEVLAYVYQLERGPQAARAG